MFSLGGNVMVSEHVVTDAQIRTRANIDPVMDRTVKFMWHRGLLVTLAIHPFYKSLSLLHRYAVTGQTEMETSLGPLFWWLAPFKLRLTLEGDQLVLSVSAWTRLRRLWDRITPGKKAATQGSPVIGRALSAYSGVPGVRADLKSGQKAQVFALLLLVSLASSLLTIAVYLPWYVLWALARGFYTTLKTALRPIPSLLAVLVVVFATSDAWQLFGLQSRSRFTMLIVIVLALSVAALAVGLHGEDGSWRAILGYTTDGSGLLEDWAQKTPARVLAAEGVAPVLPIGHRRSQRGHDDGDRGFELRPLAINVTLLYLSTMMLHVFAVAFWISLVFVVIGVALVSGPVTQTLSHHRAIVLLHFKFLGVPLVLTQQLVLLSVVLGVVAALSFAASALQGDSTLRAFAYHSLTDFRRSVAALGFYSGAMLELLQEVEREGVLGKLRETDVQSIRALCDYITRLSAAAGPSGGAPAQENAPGPAAQEKASGPAAKVLVMEVAPGESGAEVPAES